MADMELCILADEPGLGKTVMAISLINKNKHKKIIIVCPATLKENWAIECRKWLDPLLDIYVVQKTSDMIPLDAQIIIINYDIVSKVNINAQLVVRRYDILICDESHALKNIRARRTRAVLLNKCSLASFCSQKLMLTGTPFINSPADIYPVLKSVLDKKIEPYNNYFRYTRKFCGGHVDHYNNWICKQSTNTEELRELINPYVIRRLKADVLKDLPDKFYQHGQAHGRTNVSRRPDGEKPSFRQW